VEDGVGNTQDIWVNAANGVLGFAVAILVLATLVSVVIEIVHHVTRRRAWRAELDCDLRDLAHHALRRR